IAAGTKYTVTLTGSGTLNAQSVSFTDSVDIWVSNVAPTARAGGGGSVNGNNGVDTIVEGGPGANLLQIGGATSNDPGAAESLMYRWDIDANRDGSYAGSEVGAATGSTANLSWARLNELGIVDGKGSAPQYQYPIRLTVTDKDGGSGTATAKLV